MRFRKEKTSDEVLAQEIRDCVSELNRLRREAEHRGIKIWFRTYIDGLTRLGGLRIDSISRHRVTSL